MSKKDDKKKEGDRKEDKDEKHLKDELPELEKKERRKKEKKESVEGKAKVEAVLEDESSSEEEAVKITRVGYVEMKSKKEWKAVYCVLIGGSLYWSKSSTVRLSLRLTTLNVLSLAPRFLLFSPSNP
jgi:hypothetical protein